MNASVRDDNAPGSGETANPPPGGLSQAPSASDSSSKEHKKSELNLSAKGLPARRGKSTAASRVARRIARSMLGRAVSLRSSTGETIHGVVTGILAQRGQLRLVVGGSEYELGQILTVAPQELPRTETGA